MNNGAYTMTLVGMSGSYKLWGDGKMDILAGDPGVGFTVSHLARGYTTNPVIVEDSTFISLISQADADNQARALAVSMLDCFWSNTQHEVYCDNYGPGVQGTPHVTVLKDVFRSKVSPADAEAQSIAFGKAQTFCYFLNQQVTVTCPGGGFSEGAVSSVTVAAGVHSSLTSQADANAVATAVANATLLCTYANDDVDSDGCGAGFLSGPAVRIPPGTVVGSSTSIANTAAKALANSIRLCVPKAGGGSGDLFTGADGLPGDTGAQTGCAGNCFGYYS
jgi:hypothetical protein